MVTNMNVGADTEYLVLSWIQFHGRSAGLADALQISAVFVDGGSGGVFTRYLRQWKETRQLLRRAPQLKSVIVMMPPLPALVAVAFKTKFKLAGDLHTGVFNDPKWRWALSCTTQLLRRRGIGIVTNEALAATLRNRNVNALVLHDQVTDDYADDTYPFESPILGKIHGDQWILVPLAYAYDEPLEEILDAAKFTPEISWVLTGRAPLDYVGRAPENVIFTGFISDADYRRAVTRAPVIAALTRDENTMQRAGYEAMSAGRALLTTPMKVLTDFFEDAATFAEPESRGLALGAQHAIASAASGRIRMLQLREKRVRQQKESIAELEEWLLA